jgi:hypothetical protein
MDPVSAIVGALALGASVALKTATEQAVKDAYAKLKVLIQTRYASVSADLVQLEETPDSKSRRAVIEEVLQRDGAQTDPNLRDIAAQAQALVSLIRNRAPEANAATGIVLEDVEAVNTRLADIVASGTGVKITNGTFTGDIDIRGVRAGVPGNGSSGEGNE